MITTLTDLNVQSIKRIDAEEAPVAAAIATLVTSIAGSDCILTPHEFATGLAVADAVAGLSDEPAVFRSLILRAFDAGPKPLNLVLSELRNWRACLPEPARRPLLEALFPLLSTQGGQARPLARRIALALAITNAKEVLESSGLPPESGSMAMLLRRAGNALSRDTGRLEIAAEVALFAGDKALVKLLHGERQGRDTHLQGALVSAFEQIQRSIFALTEARDRFDDQLEIAQSMECSADELERQFKKRLQAVSRRCVATLPRTSKACLRMAVRKPRLISAECPRNAGSCKGMMIGTYASE